MFAITKKKIILLLIIISTLLSFIPVWGVSSHRVTGRSFTYITDEEYDLLARTVSAEAGGETLECQIAVAEVILNRVDSTRFPNSIREVIYAPGQFEVVDKGMLNRTPSAKTYQAVNQALQQRTIPSNVLYFNSIGFFSWVVPYEKIDHMYFSSVGSNQIKDPVCINDITFYGDQENIMEIQALFEKEYSNNSQYGEKWYGNYLREININTNSNNSSGYINTISDVYMLDGNYYIQLRSYSDNDEGRDFIEAIASYFEVDYAYMSTDPANEDNKIYDENYLFYKYGYLVMLNGTKSKYLKTESDVLRYINDQFQTSFTSYEMAKKFVEEDSLTDGVSIIYKYNYIS